MQRVLVNMLPRAASRTSPYFYSAIKPRQIAPSSTSNLLQPSSAIWARQYAHFGGSGGGSKKPPASQPSRAGKRPTDFTQYNSRQSGSSGNEAGRNHENAKETAEFNRAADPTKNTVPRSQPGPSVRNTAFAASDRASNSTKDLTSSSKETPEINRAADSAKNTAPGTQPGPDVRSTISSQSGSGGQSHTPPSQDTTRQAAPTGDSAQATGTSSMPLPDLRQGIPSTFAEEFLKQSSTDAHQKHAQEIGDENLRSESQKLNAEIEDLKEQDAEATREYTATGGKGGNAELPRSAYETSTDKRRNKIMNWTYLSMLIFGTVGVVYAGRNWDTDEEEKAHLDAPSGWDLGNFWGRIKARYNEQMGYLTEPTFPKLLPTMDPMPPYTLVLSLEDLMIHSEWTRQHGYRTAKRPGLDQFLRYLSQYYELVVFTSLPMSQAEIVIRKLDPFHIIMWPLFREATRYHNGNYIKDLSYLNRDLSKVIILDTKASHVSANPENAIILPPWKGDPKDRDLVSYIPFLENIAAMGYPDVRKAIKSFEGKHIPAEFARREAELREEFRKQMEAGKGKKPRFSLGGVLNKSLGIKAQPAPGAMIIGDDGSTANDGFEKGLMLSDQIRERGKKAYEQLEREIRENGAKWLKEMEEEEKKMQEEAMKGMKSNVGGVMGWFGGQQKPEHSEQPAVVSDADVKK